jgi:hypothetical protein
MQYGVASLRPSIHGSSWYSHCQLCESRRYCVAVLQPQINFCGPPKQSPRFVQVSSGKRLVDVEFYLLGICVMLVSCLTYSLTLKMEATCSSKTSDDFQRTTQRYIPEDRTHHNDHCENLKTCRRLDTSWFSQSLRLKTSLVLTVPSRRSVVWSVLYPHRWFLTRILPVETLSLLQPKWQSRLTARLAEHLGQLIFHFRWASTPER